MGTVTAPWKQLLLNSLHSNSHLRHSTYFQLATIAPNGMPANRTVVFRGFQDTTNKIQINTDCRSHKLEDINHWPFAEICWYFTDSWEQYRINGSVDVIDGSNPDPIKLQVDYLNLKSNERICFSRKIANEEISWNSEKVNP